jgi:hypothetical protein
MSETKQKKEKREEVITAIEAAKELRMTPQTIRLWITLGKIDSSKCFQIGRRGHWRIQKSAIQKLIVGGIN